MGLFESARAKRVIPLLRLVIDFEDYYDRRSEVNPFNGDWEIGGHSDYVERVDDLIEIRRLEYDHGAPRPPRKPGEFYIAPDHEGRRFVTSPCEAEFVSTYLSETGIEHILEDLDDLCDVSNLERLVLLGRFRSWTSHTADGYDYDCEFEIEGVEELIVNVSARALARPLARPVWTWARNNLTSRSKCISLRHGFGG